MPSNPIPTYIGIAFFAIPIQGHSFHSTIVLSANMQFDGNVLNGTVISSVNGRKVAWKQSDNSPAIFDQSLRPVSVIMIAKVDYDLGDVFKSVHSLVWNAEDVRVHSNGPKEAYSYDFVCRAVFYLCDNRIITLSSNMKNNLDARITDCLGKLLKNQGSRLLPIIHLEGGDIFFGRTIN